MASLFSYKSSLLSYKSCLLLQSPLPHSQNYWIGQPNRYRTDSKSKFLTFSPENVEIQLHIQRLKWGSCAFIILLVIQFSSVQSLSRVWLFATPWITARQASLSITNSRSSLKLTSLKSVMASHPLPSPSPPASNPSQHQSLFQWFNSSHEVAKVLEFQLQHHSFQRTPRTDLL